MLVSDLLSIDKAAHRAGPVEQIKRMKRAQREGWPSVWKLAGRYAGQTLVLVGGGPSAADVLPNIVKRTDCKIACINTSYDAVMFDYGRVPDFGLIADVGFHTLDYITPHPDSIFIHCSQIHPMTLHKFNGYRTYIYHTAVTKNAYKPGAAKIDDIAERTMYRLFPPERGHVWVFVHGGSTLGLRAPIIFTMLGFRRIEVVGFDSCTSAGALHWHPKSVEDLKTPIGRSIDDGRKIITGFKLIDPLDGEEYPYQSTTSMARQVDEWPGLMEMLGDHVDIVAHGDGPIPWMMKKRGRHVECRS